MHLADIRHFWRNGQILFVQNKMDHFLEGTKNISLKNDTRLTKILDRHIYCEELLTMIFGLTIYFLNFQDKDSCRFFKYERSSKLCSLLSNCDIKVRRRQLLFSMDLRILYGYNYKKIVFYTFLLEPKIE
jgi:hypothetical protein